MILTGEEIMRRLHQDIYIEDFSEERLGPNSYNLRLGDKLLVYTDPVLDMRKKNPVETITIPKSGLLLVPGKLYLGCTKEYTETYNLVPMLEGRSSVGRLGISVHVTAGFGDVGYKGCWTLEITCTHPVRIYPDVEICQIYYHTLCGSIVRQYSGKYQCATLPGESQLYRDFRLNGIGGRNHVG